MRFVLLFAMAVYAGLVLPAQARPDGATSLNGTALYRSIARAEATRQGVPFHLVDAVMWVESRYNPAATGGVGEIGLMQIRPSTAHLLGFRGTLRQLRWPETNIRFGTKYLARAWQLGGEDICTAVMKYRAGHGETRFSQRSVDYCKKVRSHIAQKGIVVAGTVPKPTFGFYSQGANRRYGRGMKGFVRAPRTKDCYARVVQPGPRFGACIPLSKLLKRGLVVNVIRPKKKSN